MSTWFSKSRSLPMGIRASFLVVHLILLRVTQGSVIPIVFIFSLVAFFFFSLIVSFFFLVIVVIIVVIVVAIIL
jgi:hypothetical protein